MMSLCRLFYPFKVPSLLKHIYPRLEWSQNPDKKNIYLTFDDGPHPEITPWVVETLQQYNALASFFCVGENASKFPSVIETLRNAGHAVGNHTHNHLKGWKTPSLDYLKNVFAAEKLLPGKLFRPPYGRITRQQISLLMAQGFRIVMWSLLSCDYLKTLDREKSLRALVKYSCPGSIVVFHDSEKAEHNLKWLLPRYLKEMAAQGYNFVPLQ